MIQLHPAPPCVKHTDILLYFPLALQPKSGLGSLHETFRFTSCTLHFTYYSLGIWFLTYSMPQYIKGKVFPSTGLRGP
jgi:hypothetical protein